MDSNFDRTSCQVFDSKTCAWGEIPFNCGFSCHGACVLYNSIYFIGGYNIFNDQSMVTRYSFDLGIIVPEASMHIVTRLFQLFPLMRDVFTFAVVRLRNHYYLSVTILERDCGRLSQGQDWLEDIVVQL